MTPFQNSIAVTPAVAQLLDTAKKSISLSEVVVKLPSLPSFEDMVLQPVLPSEPAEDLAGVKVLPGIQKTNLQDGSDSLVSLETGQQSLPALPLADAIPKPVADEITAISQPVSHIFLASGGSVLAPVQEPNRKVTNHVKPPESAPAETKPAQVSQPISTHSVLEPKGLTLTGSNIPSAEILPRDSGRVDIKPTPTPIELNPATKLQFPHSDNISVPIIEKRSPVVSPPGAKLDFPPAEHGDAPEHDFAKPVEHPSLRTRQISQSAPVPPLAPTTTSIPFSRPNAYVATPTNPTGFQASNPKAESVKATATPMAPSPTVVAGLGDIYTSDHAPAKNNAVPENSEQIARNITRDTAAPNQSNTVPAPERPNQTIPFKPNISPLENLGNNPSSEIEMPDVPHIPKEAPRERILESTSAGQEIPRTHSDIRAAIPAQAEDPRPTADHSLDAKSHSLRIDRIEGNHIPQTSALSPPDTPKHVASQLVQALKLAPDQPVEIALDPVELGKVRMTLNAGEKHIVVQIVAERPETSDMIRRHLTHLESEFRSIGYDDIGFDFAHSNPGNTDQSQQTEEFDTAGSESMATVQPLSVNPLKIHLSNETGLDLRL